MTAPDLRDAVAEHGWLVGRGPGDTASTVGLTARGLPELLVVGLPPDVGGALLHELASRLLGAPDEPPADGAPLPGLLDGAADPVLVTVDRPLPELPAAEVYGTAVPVRQLVWPDADGRFPWHPGFAHADLQPLLGRAPGPVVEAPVAATLPDEWPLPDDPHLQVLVSRRVATGEEPVRMVVCTEEGELRFLDGVGDFDPDTAVVECLHEALERDLTLLDALRPLVNGQLAERDDVGRPWAFDDW